MLRSAEATREAIGRIQVLVLAREWRFSPLIRTKNQSLTDKTQTQRYVIGQITVDHRKSPERCGAAPLFSLLENIGGDATAGRGIKRLLTRTTAQRRNFNAIRHRRERKLRQYRSVL